MVRKLYPYGKKKAFNVTYDDGVLQDVRFVQLLNRYGLCGTFNLNSGLAENGFEWMHECGLVVKRLRTDALVALYDGHEVASHTLTHPYMDNLSRDKIMYELARDRANLEKLFCREVRGFAVPFNYYSDLIAACVKECGFTYARISEESHSFCPPDDFYHWRATVFHCCDEVEELLQRYIATDEELALFQIVGHTYDLEVADEWAHMERICALISCQEDVLPMTTIGLADYLGAMRAAEITAEHIRNNSGSSLWFDIDGNVREVKPGGTFPLRQ